MPLCDLETPPANQREGIYHQQVNPKNEDIEDIQDSPLFEEGLYKFSLRSPWIWLLYLSITET